MNANTSRHHFRPTLFTGIGGFGCKVLLVMRAQMWLELGFLPKCFRWLAIDFDTDPPRAPVNLFSGEIAADAWEQVRFQPGELGLLPAYQDCPNLANRMQQGEADVAWLSQVIDPALLKMHTGSEAQAVPAIGRAELLLAALNHQPTLEPSWFAKLGAHLETLSPTGRAGQEFRSQSSASAALERHPAYHMIVAGTEGGTGGGCLLPVAIASSWLARKAGLHLSNQAVLISGHYRSRDGQEERKSALSHAVHIDVERSMNRRLERVDLPLGPEETAQALGRVFDKVWMQESAERLMHDERAMLALTARTLVFQNISQASFEMAKSQSNSGILPQIGDVTSIQRNR